MAAERTAEPPSQAERHRRRRLLLPGFGALVLAGLLLVLPTLDGLQDRDDSRFFLLLNALGVFLILLLGLQVARNLWKLLGERREGLLGSHLHLRFVSAFLFICLITATGLFAVSAFFITRSIDRWFSVQVDGALEQSGEVAQSYYEAAGKTALGHGRRIAAEIAARRMLRGSGRLPALTALVDRELAAYDLGIVEVFGAGGEEVVIGVNPEVPAASFSRSDSDIVRAALAGEASWRVEEVGAGDLIRAAVPVPSGRPGRVAGAVVVNAFVPFALARKVDSIRGTLDAYRQLPPSSVRTTQLLGLGLALLGVVMLGGWTGFRLARSVTGPIRALAEGTAEVARGNLDVEVEQVSDDELGLLVQSFNRMTHDLREARAGAERSAAELEQRRRTMETVLGTIGGGVVSVDAGGRVTTINPTAQRYLGVPAGVGAIGHKLADVTSRAEVLDVVDELAPRLRPGVRESLRQQVQVTEGEEVETLLVTLRILHGEGGEPLGTVIVLDDYTQVVQVQRMVAWREVARRIAHEIKNPLTPIQLSAERIRRRFREPLGASPEEAQVLDECVDTITTQVEGLKLLVDEFSNFARLPAANPQPDDLNRLVTEAVASYAGDRRVRFETLLDPDLPPVELDRAQIRRVLSNLIDNAIAAARPAGDAGEPGTCRVALSSHFDPGLQSVRLEIADDGVGVAPADRRRIFEPYFSTTERGTGLGLAIVSRIVADHRGYIRVQDNAPVGTRFVIELPPAARGARA